MLEALSPDGITTDARYALRALRRDIGLATFSTLIIALGVGATTAVFSILHPLLLAPLPFEDPDRLLWIANDGSGGRSAVTSRADNLRDFRLLSSSFEAIAGYDAFFEQGSYSLLGQGEPERLAGVGVTDDFLDVLGVLPTLGRNFTEEEGRRWDHSAIILTHSLWQRLFSADPNVVGTQVTLNGAPSVVVGVLPQAFDFSSIFTPASRVDLLTTFPINDATDDTGNTLAMIGRLAPGVEADEARAEMKVLVERLRRENPDRWGLGAAITPLREHVSGGHRAPLLLLLAAAAAVMLIVCVNLTSLLLSKGLRRSQEMSLRSALGAPRGRLLRQMMIESLMLAVTGAALGVGLAHVLVRAVSGTTGLTIPMLSSVQVDGTVLAFASTMALVVGLAVGLLPALRISGAGSASALRAAGRTLTHNLRTRRLREALVVAEVAVACGLLVVGGLLLLSFSKVLDEELGFEPDNLAAWLVDTDRRFDSTEERTSFFETLADEVRRVPGVTAVGLTDAIPLGINRQWGIGIPGRTFERGEVPNVYPHIVDRHYLDTMGISLLRGRGFEASDSSETMVVGLLNRSAAARLFPGEDALGKTISVGGEVTIVGVVEDVRHLGLDQGSGLQLYLSMAQVGNYSTLDLVVRSELPLASIHPTVTAAVRRIDPSMPTNDVRTLNRVVDQAVSPRRFTLSILAGFAAAALVLAALGIFSVLSYSVSERSREVAIRMALGESATQVRRRVLGRTLALAALGSVLGVGLSMAASRWVASLLYGVEPTHPTTLFISPLVVLVVALLAGWIPAWRASRVDALATLQST